MDLAEFSAKSESCLKKLLLKQRSIKKDILGLGRTRYGAVVGGEEALLGGAPKWSLE